MQIASINYSTFIKAIAYEEALDLNCMNYPLEKIIV